MVDQVVEDLQFAVIEHEQRQTEPEAGFTVKDGDRGEKRSENPQQNASFVSFGLRSAYFVFVRVLYGDEAVYAGCQVQVH